MPPPSVRKAEAASRPAITVGNIIDAISADAPRNRYVGRCGPRGAGRPGLAGPRVADGRRPGRLVVNRLGHRSPATRLSPDRRSTAGGSGDTATDRTGDPAVGRRRFGRRQTWGGVEEVEQVRGTVWG